MNKKNQLFVVDNGDVQDRLGIHRRLTAEEIRKGQEHGWLKKDARIRPASKKT